MKYWRYIFIVNFFWVNFIFANEEPKSIDDNPDYIHLLKVGDWIFRKGVQIDSLVVNELGGGGFSHIGIIVSIEPEVKVIHATTDDDINHPNQVIVSTLAEFITPKLAEKYAIARPNFLSPQQQQLIVDHIQSQLGAPFILSSREKKHLYCTTLLADTIIKYQPDFRLQWNYVNFPLFNGDYLFPSAFANHNDITWIYKYPKEY